MKNNKPVMIFKYESYESLSKRPKALKHQHRATPDESAQPNHHKAEGFEAIV